MKGLKRIGVIGALMVAGFLLAAFIGEVFLRLAGIDAPALYRYDHDLGYDLQPGAVGEFDLEGHSFVTINAQGLRGPERAIPKPNDVFRVLVVGDSYIEAFHVPYAQTMSAQLETLLRERLNRPIEVVAMGVSGYGSTQEWLKLVRDGFAFSPDLVLLAFLPGNDVVDNSRVLNGRLDRPYAVLNGDRLELDHAFRDTFDARFKNAWLGKMLYRLKGHSALLRVLRFRLSVLRQQIANPHLVKAPPTDIHSRDDLPLSSELRLYDPDPVPEWRDAWRLSMRLIRQIRLECAKRRVRFGLMSLTSGRLVDPPTYQEFKQRYPFLDPDFPERRLGAFAANHGIEYLPLAPAMLARARQSGEVFHGFGENRGRGHWNAVGHRAAAEILSDWLIADELLKPVPR